MTTPHYIENSADAIRFVRDRPWYPLDESHVYEVPVSALGTICMACWATLEDTRFAGNVIDDETLRGRYFELCNREDDEAVQKEWGRFSDDLWAYVDGMGLERQATWFIELNDPSPSRGTTGCMTAWSIWMPRTPCRDSRTEES